MNYHRSAVEQTINQASVDLLRAFANDSVVDLAIKLKCQIEEEDVETVPENINVRTLANVDEDLLVSLKKYFTEDAWMCFTNTLGVIKKTLDASNEDQCRLDAHSIEGQLNNDMTGKPQSSCGPSSSSEVKGVTLKEFLCTFTSESVVELAIRSSNHLIGKDDLSDAHKDIFTEIDTDTLDSAEQYFTREAWVCVKNLLKSAESEDIVGKMPGSCNSDNVCVGTTDKDSSGTYKKPYRPCPFCSRLSSKLRTHLERKHKDETEVKQALLLPKNQRNKAFDDLRKKGILKHNMPIMTEKKLSLLNLQRERKSRKVNDEVVYCSKCYAFVSKAFFHRHKRLCYMAHNVTVPTKIQLSIHCGNEGPGRFEKEILSTLHNDEVGSLCKSDSLIISYGRREYKKVSVHTDKIDEKRKTLKSDLRRLARLYITFKSICHEQNVSTDSSMDLFRRPHFSILEESILRITSDDDGVIRDGFKLGIGYLLKKVSKYVYGFLLESKEDEKAMELTKFIDLLNFHWMNLFGESEYAVKKTRQSTLRKPVNLPLENDVKMLRDFTVSEIKLITKDEFKMISPTEYVRLRDLLVCRLTLFNARRGGEPSRLKIKEWNDAENNVWQQHINADEITDPIEKQLFQRFKLAYQPGKTGKLVPLLIIDDCWKGLRILTDPEVRSRIGISKENDYVFPYTQLSNSHVIGWNAMNSCSKLAGCSKAINATNRRHHVATMYAAQEVPADERAGFLMHMDHSEQVNINVYQSPPAVKEITKVGRFLLQLDNASADETTSQTLPGDDRTRTPDSMHTTCYLSADETTSEILQGGDRTRTPDSMHLTSPLSADEITSETLSRDDRTRDPDSMHTDCSVYNANKASVEGKTVRGTRRQTRSHRELVFSSSIGAEKTTQDRKRPSNFSDLEDSGDEYQQPRSPVSSSDDSFDEIQKEQLTSPKKKRPYWKWNESQTRCIQQYFKKYIFSSEHMDSNKGSLPGKKDVQTFLQKFPEIVPGENLTARVNKVKTKVFNERKEVRRKMAPSGI